MPSTHLNAALGSIAALVSAASWAVSSMLFAKIGHFAPPAAINLGKCALGALLLGILVLLNGWQPMCTRDLVLIGASGLIGIALGDTFFFKSLLDMGPRLTLLIGTLGPVVTIIMAVLILGEKPSVLAWSGMAVTLAGVKTVIFAENGNKKNPGRNISRGIKFGLLAVLCNSAAIIMAKTGVEQISATQGSFIRFFCGMTGLALTGASLKQTHNWIKPFKNGRLFAGLITAVLIAIFGGFFLFLYSLKHIDASTAAILNETTPLFIIPLAAVFLKEKISKTAAAGAAIAVCGIAMIISG